MSRLVYFDCASGASGDMVLGAIVDAGVSLEDLRSDLARLALPGVRLDAGPVTRRGLRAMQVYVRVDKPQPRRGLKEIRALLSSSGLEAPVRDRCGALFQRLAEVEGEVHGCPPEEVHFHEVGGADSIADVVLGVAGLARLGASRFASSPVNIGSGEVEIDHGRFSIPAPATTRLLEGVPVYGSGEGELMTPTGALLLTSHVSRWGPLPPMRLQRSGYGAGSRESGDRPNVLRLMVGEEEDGPDEVVLVLECEIDDMAPQLLAPVVERLLADGAHDAYVTPVLMKKGRPGHLISVLAPPHRRAVLEEVLLTETTTLGVRRQEWARHVLDRQTVVVTTAYGPIQVKVGRRGDRVYNAQPEFEDCRRAARESGAPLKEVWAAALHAWRGGGDAS